MSDDSTSRRILIYAAITGALAILAGTFGAHALPQYCQWQGYEDLERRSELVDIGVRYHLVHSVALLALAAIQQGSPTSRIWVSRLFVIGLVCFSGGLYGLAISELRALAFVAPIGGVAFIIGWLMLLTVGRKSRVQSP